MPRLVRPADFAQFMKKETQAQWIKGNQLAQVSVERALAEAIVVGPLTFAGIDGQVSIWKASGNYSRFREGDRAKLIPISENRLKHRDGDLGIEVRSLDYSEPGTIEIRTQRLRNPPAVGLEYVAVPFDDFSFINNKIIKELNGLDQFMGAGDRPIVPISLKRISELERTQRFIDTLNITQKDAFLSIVENGMFGCVQGPPGTGKSHLIRSMVQYCLEQGLKVVMTAFTHTAVDKLCSVLDDVQSTGTMYRVGNSLKVKSSFYKVNQPIIFLDSMSNLPQDAQFVAATTHSWALYSGDFEPDVIFVDEAGQVPAYFLPLLERLCPRIVAVGDHKQLPPVLLSNAEKVGFPIDLFSYSLKDFGATMLETQYRMNRQIQSWSSERYYDSKLQPAEANSNRDTLGQTQIANVGVRRVNGFTHNMPCLQGACVGEASAVADLVRELLSKGCPPQEVGIITPHRMHAGAVNSALHDNLGVDAAKQISVDTVERFQGQEKEVVVLSFGSDGSFSGVDHGRELDFLSQSNRINVSVTRARSRFFCFASNKLLAAAKADRDSELSDFIDWSLTS